MILCAKVSHLHHNKQGFIGTIDDVLNAESESKRIDAIVCNGIDFALFCKYCDDFEVFDNEPRGRYRGKPVYVRSSVSFIMFIDKNDSLATSRFPDIVDQLMH